MSKSLRIFLGLLLSSLCLWLAFRHFSWSDLYSAAAKANWHWFFPLTGVALIAHLLRSLRWSLLLSPVKKISPLQLFPLIMFGFLMNNIFPARAGEVARAYVASKKNNLTTATFIGSIAMERLTDLIGLGSVMMVALNVLPLEKLPLRRLGIILIGGAMAIALLIYLVRFQKKKDRPRAFWIEKLATFLDHLILGFSSLASPKKIISIALIAVSIWMLEVTCLLFGSKAFHLDLGFSQSCALLSGISFGVMIPAAPGYIGTYEYFGKEALRYLGFPGNISLPYLLSFHFYQMLICFLLGLPTLIQFGFLSRKKEKTIGL